MKMGRNEMMISDCGFRKSGKETPGVVINGTIGDESVTSIIWISEASANMAHRALKMCGFDSNIQDLAELKANPALLRGHSVQVNVSEDPQYGLKVEIALNVEPNDDELNAANSLLKGRGKAVSGPF